MCTSLRAIKCQEWMLLRIFHQHSGQVWYESAFQPSGTGLFMVNKDWDQILLRDFNYNFH